MAMEGSPCYKLSLRFECQILVPFIIDFGLVA